MLSQEERQYLSYVRGTVIPGLQKAASENRLDKTYHPEVQEALELADSLEKMVQDIEGREMRADLLVWLNRIQRN